MKAYYSEIDPFKAEVLRQAISAGAIAPGDVDERSIADVRADDLRGYSQCHFFAGGGFWSLALRQAGWRDDQPVWTGSCPCPSFSAAGKGEGFNDPRHLWPEWFRLIRECKPPVIFGEQVDAAIGHGWLDLVGMDVEGEGYAIAAAVLPAASVGAPHRRNRLYFVAESERGRREQRDAGLGSVSIADENGESGELDHAAGSRCDGPVEEPEGNTRDSEWLCLPGKGRGDGLLVNAEGRGFGIGGDEAQPGRGGYADRADEPLRMGEPEDAGLGSVSIADENGESGELDHAAGSRCDGPVEEPEGNTRDSEWLCLPGKGRGDGELVKPLSARLEGQPRHGGDGNQPGRDGEDAARPIAEAGESGGMADINGSAPRESGHAAQPDGTDRPGPTNGFWRNADWLGCRDGKFRAVESGTFPLAHGSAARVGRLRSDGAAVHHGATEARVGRLRMYGDAICVPVAETFIKCSMEAIDAAD